jgi:hypothetical protein
MFYESKLKASIQKNANIDITNGKAFQNSSQMIENLIKKLYIFLEVMNNEIFLNDNSNNNNNNNNKIFKFQFQCI